MQHQQKLCFLSSLAAYINPYLKNNFWTEKVVIWPIGFRALSANRIRMDPNNLELHVLPKLLF
jgi:hypothetical protein